MSVKIFNLSLQVELVAAIDAQAKLNYSSRSEYIKHAIITRLKSEGAFDASMQPQTLQQLKNQQLKDFLEEYALDQDDEDEEYLE